MKAALGFRPHTGWATVVTLAGDAAAAVVVDRRRLDLSDPLGPDQAYHAARELPLGEAAELVRRAETAAQEAAVQGLGALAEMLRQEGHELVGAGLPVTAARVAPTLQQALASHVLLHSAEGALFREALMAAAHSHEITVVQIPARELTGRAKRALHHDQGLDEALTELGLNVGPPWRKEEKDAALAAWLALALGSG